MNYFFGFKSDVFSCNLTIPKFRNDESSTSSLCPYECFVQNNKWKIQKSLLNENKNFFFIKNSEIDNEKIFFLTNDFEIKKNFHLFEGNLTKLNSFTDTEPVQFRSNLRIYKNESGFSSYQSEYPYDMTIRKGSILTPIFTLLNQEADSNFIIFRNIYSMPINTFFDGYLVDLKKKCVLKKIKLQTNRSNKIDIEKKYIEENTFLYTENFLGVPIYVSVKSGHISMEHTHPPHLYILGEDRYSKVKKLKDYVKNIIYK